MELKPGTILVNAFVDDDGIPHINEDRSEENASAVSSNDEQWIMAPIHRLEKVEEIGRCTTYTFNREGR